MQFDLHITLGNDWMQNPLDVAYALRGLADRLEASNSAAGWDTPTGTVRDLNGNTVGRWTVEEDE